MSEHLTPKLTDDELIDWMRSIDFIEMNAAYLAPWREAVEQARQGARSQFSGPPEFIRADEKYGQVA